MMALARPSCPRHETFDRLSTEHILPRFLSGTSVPRRVVSRRMPGVRVKEGESFENAMKRFKKQCEKAGILSEIRKREHYEKPSVKRKKKALAAKKRALKKARKGMM